MIEITSEKIPACQNRYCIEGLIPSLNSRFWFSPTKFGKAYQPIGLVVQFYACFLIFILSMICVIGSFFPDGTTSTSIYIIAIASVIGMLVIDASGRTAFSKNIMEIGYETYRRGHEIARETSDNVLMIVEYSDNDLDIIDLVSGMDEVRLLSLFYLGAMDHANGNDVLSLHDLIERLFRDETVLWGYPVEDLYGNLIKLIDSEYKEEDDANHNRSEITMQ